VFVEVAQTPRADLDARAQQLVNSAPRAQPQQPAPQPVQPPAPPAPKR
jgi:hypothetical protein